MAQLIVTVFMMAMGAAACSSASPGDQRTPLAGLSTRSTLGFAADDVSELGQYHGSLHWLECAGDAGNEQGTSLDLSFGLVHAEGTIYEVEQCGGSGYVGNADCRSYVELPVRLSTRVGAGSSVVSTSVGVIRAYQPDDWRLYVRTAAVQAELRCPLGRPGHFWFDAHHEPGQLNGHFGLTWADDQGSSGTAGGYVAAALTASYLAQQTDD